MILCMTYCRSCGVYSMSVPKGPLNSVYHEDFCFLTFLCTFLGERCEVNHGPEFKAIKRSRVCHSNSLPYYFACDFFFIAFSSKLMCILLCEVLLIVPRITIVLLFFLGRCYPYLIDSSIGGFYTS